MENQAKYIVSREDAEDTNSGHLAPDDVSLEFMEKVAALSSDREKLLALMNELDANKRSIKSRLRRMSSEPDGKFGRGRERQVQIRKMRDKLGFLTVEREYVRRILGQLKGDKKALNRVVNGRKLEFCHAFMAAAERMLEPELFHEIEIRAGSMLEASDVRKQGEI